MMLFALIFMTSAFTNEPVSQKMEKEMKDHNTFNDKISPIGIDRLRLLTIKYFDFDGKENIGQMVVLDACADEVLEIFKELYKVKFPINKICLMHTYNGDDNASMDDNNTSCHNCRDIAGKKTISLHAYGAAIDINPIQNPFVEFDEDHITSSYNPKKGMAYANRLVERVGKTKRVGMAEEVISVFAKHGFYYWGGYWDTPIDYQHFQLSRSMAKLYSIMDPKSAAKMFLYTRDYFNKHKVPMEEALETEIKNQDQNSDIVDFYSKNPNAFNKIVDILVKRTSKNKL